jgi:pyruvate,water dikinase
MTGTAFFRDITKDDVDIAGGKGASLGEMTRAGIPIPPGFVVLSGAFDRFVGTSGVREEIAARLGEVNPDDMSSIERASGVLRDIIHDTPMPDDLQAEILSAYKKLGANFVAVRSSATAEDSEIASWAGELETYLNTTKEYLLDHMKKCWSSLFTPRAIFYRHEKKLIDTHVSVAVVVQKMIQSEVSGVAFTVHPVTEDPDQMIIEAGYGLGEAIVSGQITPDAYIVSKSDMAIFDIHIGEQAKKLVKVGESNAWMSLDPKEGKKQKLSGRHIVELAKLCKDIEVHYGFPCDIEWAFADGHFYITQSRPITTLNK